MLPDFPRIKKKVIAAVIEDYLSNAAEHPFLSKVKREFRFQGDQYRKHPDILQENDGVSTSEKAQDESKLQTEDIISHGHLLWISWIRQYTVRSLNDDTEKMLGLIRDVTDKTNNVVDTGRQLSAVKAYLKVIEKYQLKFNQQGEPTNLDVWPPRFGERVKTELPQWLRDPDNRLRYQKLMERKKAEWLDRESNRKLVD
jgi:hypothetical protein